MTSNNDDDSSAARDCNQNDDVIDLTDDKTPRGQPIDLTGSDEDEDSDLKLAIALSLQDQQSFESPSMDNYTGRKSQSPVAALPKELPQPGSKQKSIQPSSGDLSGFLGLDRKQMEAERLARLKRKREATAEDRAVSPPPLRRKIPSSTQHTKSTIVTGAGLNIGHAHRAAEQLSSSAATASASPVSLGYPCGKIFLTSSDKARSQSISFSELLKPTVSDAPLKSALLSTYTFDFDWLFPHFETQQISFVLALHAQNDQAKQLLQQDFAGIPNVRLAFPYIGANVNCMHSKLMLLFYESVTKDPKTTRCRLVVPSANLVPWDWGVGAIVENILFMIDLPLRDESVSESHRQNTVFKNSIMDMLQTMQIPKDVLKKLEAFDFSPTAVYRFIHTIGGSHLITTTSEPTGVEKSLIAKNNRAGVQPQTSTFTSPYRTGLLHLCDAVRSMGFGISPGEAAYPLKIDFITSSIGNIKKSFVQSLIMAACGQELEPPAKPKNGAKTSQTGPFEDATMSKTILVPDNMKVYFPSDRTVRNSKGGPASAGTITFQSKWWDGPEHEFFRKMLCDCVGVRQDGILLHSKVLFARFAKPKKLESALGVQYQRAKLDSSQSALPPRIRSPLVTTAYSGWAYIGSANLSQSAWGSLVTDSKTRQPKLSCRNWESGVLIPVPSRPEHEGKNLHDLPLEDIFRDVVPVPIRYPGDSIQENGGRPWFFNG